MHARLLVLSALIVLFQGCRFGAARTAEPEAPAVNLEASVDGKALLAEKSSPALVKLVIRPRAEDPARRVPANLALVVDTSGSMEGKALEDARAAALALVRSLADGDRLAVITFGSRAELLQPATELDAGTRAAVEQKLAALRASGTTDLGAGLTLGLEQVESGLSSDGIHRVVLLGDGIPNDAAPIQALVDRARAASITITALGLGLDYDEALMARIARGSGGKFRHIEDSTQVAGFLRDEVLRLQGVVAKNAVLELTTGPGVRVSGVVGQSWQPTATGARLELGDVSRGDVRTVYVELSAQARRAGSPIELVDAKLAYAEKSGAAASTSTFVAARSTDQESAVRAGRDASIELGAAFARSAHATVQAVDFARRGNERAAKAVLENTASQLEAIAARLGNARLAEEAKALRALTTDLPPPTAMPETVRPTAAMPARSSEQARRALRQHDEAIQRLQ